MEGGRPVVLNNILVAMKPTDGAVTVPAGVETIVDYAFYQNEDLFSVILPNGLKQIGSDAFNGCKNLKSIAIPPTVETIGENALNGIERNGLVFFSRDLNIDEAGLDGDKIKLKYSTDKENKKLSVYELRNGDNLVYFTESQINIPEYIGGYKTEVSELVKTVIESYEKTIQFSHVHVGGTATCDKPAVCVICEQEYGEKGSHVFSDEWITDGTHHWNECTLCNAKRNYAEHSGGTLTCTEQAECIMCGEKYGTPGHKYSSEWITDGENHWHECTECGDRKDVSAHAFKTTTYKATLVTDGKIETKCTVCNKVTKTMPVYAASDIHLSKDAVAYTGKVQKPKVVVKDSKGNAIAASNYKVTLPTGLKQVGSYKVKVTLKGDLYEGSKTLTFKINPVKTKLSSIKTGKKSFTIKWTKMTKEVSSYEIQYALKKDFKGAKKTVIKSAKTTSKEIKKLKSKKTYYVHIRTYKTVKGKKFYSDWSATKKVKVK